MRAAMAALMLCACTSTVELDGDAERADAPIMSPPGEVEAWTCPGSTGASADPPDPCACAGEYLVDNALLLCDPTIDGSRLTLTCDDDGWVTVEIDGILLRGEHRGGGAFAAVGEYGCHAMVMEGTLPDCRIRADWSAVGCDCPESLPIYAVPVS